MHMAERARNAVARMSAAMARARAALTEHAYLITLGAVVAVVAASAMYTSHLREENAEGVQAAADAPEIYATPSPGAETTPLPTIAPLEVRTAVLQTGGGTVWPASGEIVRGHSPQTPVLWEALFCVRTHEGVDIAGEAGESVLLAMDGVVSAVTMDALWGCSVQVEQTDGALATYAGLASADVQAGQGVTRGQAIGTLGDIPCEAELGAHLHFALERSGQPQDPAQLLERASRM